MFITKRKIKIFLRIVGMTVVFFPFFAYAANIINPGYTGTLDQLVTDISKEVVKIGLALLTIMIIWTGFLFISALGNENKITEAKKSLWWVVIGGAILLGATAIAAVISGTFGSIF